MIKKNFDAFDMQSALAEVSEQLLKKMDQLLPHPDGGACNVISLKDRNQLAERTPVGGEAKVLEAMRYSALSSGKRLRPFLTVSCANLFGVSLDASLHAAAERGWLDHDRAVLETLLSIRRAGADMILTYHAKEAARLLLNTPASAQGK